MTIMHTLIIRVFLFLQVCKERLEECHQSPVYGPLRDCDISDFDYFQLF